MRLNALSCLSEELQYLDKLARRYSTMSVHTIGGIRYYMDVNMSDGYPAGIPSE